MGKKVRQEKIKRERTVVCKIKINMRINYFGEKE